MKVDNIDVQKTIANAKDALANDKTISTTTKSIFELLLVVVAILFNRLNLNSTNSSKPPSSDNKKKNNNNGKKKSTNPPGGQKGHSGTTLEPVSNPDEIKNINIDKRTLPKNTKYESDGYIARQVVNIIISKKITEYRAEVLIDKKGNRYEAKFPEGITRPIQYGASVKSNAVYLSSYQLIPYERIQHQFRNEYNIPISTGSIYNFNAEASKKLLDLGFDKAVKKALIDSSVAHADETGINLNGSSIWLHNFSNDKWTWFEPHQKRGSEAMNEIGILPNFSGTLCHDHWKPYYTYSCTHSLCNAHHLRELTRAYEQDNQKWAINMHNFLISLNKEVLNTKKEKLSVPKAKIRHSEYDHILLEGNIECPAVKPEPGKKKKPKQSKTRNLLDRLVNYKDDVLRFANDSAVPFTNNQGERDIRMIKVQQKISGCFRSMDGALNFCIVRSYLSTCQKNNVPASEALEMVFDGVLPNFIQEKLNSS